VNWRLVFSTTGDYTGGVGSDKDHYAGRTCERLSPLRRRKPPGFSCGAGSRLRLILSGLEEIERAVLGWGTHATVIRPDALRRRLDQIGMELVAKYWEGEDEVVVE
jgi:hypothetical protein